MKLDEKCEINNRSMHLRPNGAVAANRQIARTGLPNVLYRVELSPLEFKALAISKDGLVIEKPHEISLNVEL